MHKITEQSQGPELIVCNILQEHKNKYSAFFQIYEIIVDFFKTKLVVSTL